MVIAIRQYAPVSEKTPVRSIRRDLLVFQFRCKEGTREVIADGLDRMMRGTRDPLTMREVVDLYQSLFNKGVIVPKVYPDQGVKEAVDRRKVSREVIQCADDDGRLRPEIRYALPGHFEKLGMVGHNLGKPGPSYVFSMLDDLVDMQESHCIDTKTTIRLIPSADHWGEFVITQETQASMITGGIRSVLENLARAGVPIKFGEIGLPSAKMDTIGGCISVLPDGVVQHAIGTYRLEGHSEIYSKSLMVRLPGIQDPSQRYLPFSGLDRDVFRD